MRRAAVVVLVGVLFLGACGGDEEDAADTSAASTTAPGGEPIVIRTRVVIAAEERAEPIATGEVLEGSTLGGSEFCAGGTNPGLPRKPRSRRVADSPDDHLPGRQSADEPYAGGAAGSDPDGLVDDRRRHRCIRGATRERGDGGRIRPRRRLASSRDVKRNCHALEITVKVLGVTTVEDAPCRQTGTPTWWIRDGCIQPSSRVRMPG